MFTRVRVATCSTPATLDVQVSKLQERLKSLDAWDDSKHGVWCAGLVALHTACAALQRSLKLAVGMVKCTW